MSIQNTNNTIKSTARSAISREEQIIAIRSYAAEYKSVTSVTATPTHMIIALDDTFEAGELCNRYRHSGWYNATCASAQLSNKWFVRVSLNA